MMCRLEQETQHLAALLSERSDDRFQPPQQQLGRAFALTTVTCQLRYLQHHCSAGIAGVQGLI